MEQRLQEAIRLREAGDHQKANEQFMELIRDFPEDAVVNYQCAWSFDVLGEEAKAVPFYERAIELGLSSEDLQGAYLGLGSTYRTLGDYEKSKKTFERAMEVFPANQVLPIFYAMTLYNLQEHSKAMELLLKCVAETSADPDIVSYKGAIEFYSTQLDKVWN
ncbi:hypothetical protein NCCP2716_26930 [Sporosarcina sp. NCCP-2716]|uniref:tetratricopeptide repeat protein n=1 Tax=Sporosarcina sp. NCCP-2716 TaxID=2943679 RepID=UPI00203D4C16|nr:tetratricopeptide repeat protein [Sporosarcina sp. NCCP-2716]GKV70195.1 hypothetical protein NCCP2716_26930 [Sporosarcina sp. NCCP-2716]